MTLHGTLSDDGEWEWLRLCYGCIGSTSEECAENGGSFLLSLSEDEEGDDDYPLASRNRIDGPILPRPDVPRSEQPQSSQEQGQTRCGPCVAVQLSSIGNSADIFTVQFSTLGNSGNVYASPVLRCFCTHATTHASGPLSVCVQYFGKSPRQALLAVQTQSDPCVAVQLSAAAPTIGEQVQLSQTLQVPTRDRIQLSQPLKVPTSPAPTGNLLGFNAFNSSMQVAPQSNLAFVSDFSVDVKPAWTQSNGCLPLAERDCVTEQSKSFGDWWSSVLGTINTFLSGVVSMEHFCFQSVSSFGTVHNGDYLRFQVRRVHDDMLRLSHDFCSARTPPSLSLRRKVALLVEGAFNSKPRDAHVHSLGDCTCSGAAVDNGESRCFSFLSLVLPCKAFLFAPQVLRYFNMTCGNGCALSAKEHALSSAPPPALHLRS